MTNKIVNQPTLTTEHNIVNRSRRVETNSELYSSEEVSCTGFLKRLGKMTTVTFGLTVFDFGIGVGIARTVASYGYCLGNYISEDWKGSIGHLAGRVARGDRVPLVRSGNCHEETPQKNSRKNFSRSNESCRFSSS